MYGSHVVAWFDDLFNLVYDPVTLQMAWDRVAGNTGVPTPVDVPAGIAEPGPVRRSAFSRYAASRGLWRRVQRCASGLLPAPG